MPKTKLKKLPGGKGKKKLLAQKKTSTSTLTLPTELSTPPTEIGAYTMLIYGMKKIGKTSLVAQFPRTFCEMFEPGGKSLKIFQRPVVQFEDHLAYLDLLESGNHDFLSVLEDTGKVFYDRCQEYVCRREGVDHPQDLPYGKGWNMVRKEMEESFSRLLNLNMGVFINCHEQIKDIESHDGEVYSRIMPDLSKQAMNHFAAIIDTIAYYHYEGDKRVLTIQGNELIEAGTRCEYNFFTTKGERVVNIPMGNSPQEAYANLIKAFNNQQTTTGKEVRLKKKKSVKLLKKAK